MSANRAALRAFETKFAKQFGAGSLNNRAKRQVVSTGSILLDHELGVGGLVVGRCYESWGPPSVGKTTVNLIMAAQQQKRFPDKMVGWVDVERSFDEQWAIAHGVDVNRLWLASPGTAEETADQVKSFLDSGFCSFVTVDSIGALISQKEIEKDAAEAVVAAVAKIVTRMIKMAAPAAASNEATFHVINQVRANIGGYGPDTAPGGGFALQHGTTAQLHFKSTSESPLAIGSGKERRIVGKTINVLIPKNKVAPPNGSAFLTLVNQPTVEFGPVGLNLGAEAFQLADQFGLWADRSGSYYTLSDGSRHHGQDETKAHLREHPKLIDEIRDRALAKIANLVIIDELKEGTA